MHVSLRRCGEIHRLANNSPFQYEVGYASLGFGIVGIIATWSSVSFRAAALIGPAFFLWGAAEVTFTQIVTEHNMAPATRASCSGVTSSCHGDWIHPARLAKGG